MSLVDENVSNTNIHQTVAGTKIRDSLFLFIRWYSGYNNNFLQNNVVVSVVVPPSIILMKNVDKGTGKNFVGSRKLCQHK